MSDDEISKLMDKLSEDERADLVRAIIDPKSLEVNFVSASLVTFPLGIKGEMKVNKGVVEDFGCREEVDALLKEVKPIFEKYGNLIGKKMIAFLDKRGEEDGD